MNIPYKSKPPNSKAIKTTEEDLSLKRMGKWPMGKKTGLNSYKKYWEDQAEFMDKEPWAKDKIIKINLLKSYEHKFKELGFSNHSLSKGTDRVIVKIKVPHNYHELDNFEDKVLELLGIEQKWLNNISIDDAHCNSSRW